MNIKWRLSIVLLIVVATALFLFFRNDDSLSSEKVVDIKADSETINSTKYYNSRLGLTFKYLDDVFQIEENETFVSLYQKENHNLILTISGDDCDVSFYNDLEQVKLGDNYFRKIKDSGYFIVHPKTGICIIIGQPGSVTEKEHPQEEKLFFNNFVSNLSFIDGNLIVSDYEFSCNDGKSLIISFINNDFSSLNLKLSDERVIYLKQTSSASGARYTNYDESIVFWNKGDSAFLEENGQKTFVACIAAPKDVSTEIDNKINKVTNPASANCLAKGGLLEIKSKEDGSQYGLCLFDDNRACEEWSLLREDCPVGGVATITYDNLAQKYCAWIGGRVVAEEGSLCVFSDGSTCLNSDLYLDACKKGDWPKK